ncbi:hypothetical protein AB0399_17345 [Streptomyces sp. NPDC088194]|uniref:hypothetical protein n=1 Tax=Streptomyces sp. NPDC088194 TaxID=3154931 RepID=UPI00344D3B32
MGSNGLINVAVAVVVLVWLLSRQLSTRPVRERSRLGFVLIVVGVIETVSFTSKHSLSGRDVSLLALSLAIGVALAAVRGFTLTVWQEGGQTFRKGGPLTAVLWIVGIGLHLLIDDVISSGLGSASVLLYFGIVLSVQRLVLLGRVQTAVAR